MLRGILAGIVIAFFVVGCSEPRIDTSNDEKMKSSIEKIKQSLSDEKTKEFEDAIKVVFYSNVSIDFKTIMALGAEGTAEKIKEEGKVFLSNKTADEVILEAKKIKDKKLEVEKQKALEEIKDLEERKAKSQKAIEELKKIEVISSTFDRKRKEYSSYLQPIINISVKNNTNKAISRIYAIGTLQTEGREIPWIKEEFNYAINGGIEPGETHNSSLAPNMFSPWGQSNVGENAKFTVNIIRVDGVDEAVIASLENFSEKDNQKLESLKVKYINK